MQKSPASRPGSIQASRPGSIQASRPGSMQASRPRMSGGMNKLPGNISGEHFDEGMAQEAVAQKALSQSAADPGQMPTSGVQGQNQSPLGTQSKQAKARPVSPKKELKWMAQDLAKGLLSIFDINAALGIDPAQDSPEDQAKKRQMHQRYQKMTQEEQAYTQELYNEKMKKQQLEEQKKEEERIRKEKENQQITMPSSPKKGPKGPGGSKKKQAIAKLEQDRKGVGKVAGAN
ncbi:MAG: hypothetical protein ABFQ62_03305 [Patescibacteria group bacterium]